MIIDRKNQYHDNNLIIRCLNKKIPNGNQNFIFAIITLIINTLNQIFVVPYRLQNRNSKYNFCFPVFLLIVLKIS